VEGDGCRREGGVRVKNIKPRPEDPKTKKKGKKPLFSFFSSSFIRWYCRFCLYSI
jgi:hypothetical protein